LFVTRLSLQIAEAKDKLLARFKMKDLSPLSLFLGMEVIRTKGVGKDNSIFLSQSQYLMRILEDFHMADCNPVGTPFPHGIQLSSLPVDENSKKPIGI